MPHRSWPALPARQGVAVLALSLACCAHNYESIPSDTYRMVPPPASADLVFSSNLYDPAPESGDDLFALDIETGTITRLTFCNRTGVTCSLIEASPSSERERLVVRRVVADRDGDGRLTPQDGAGLFFLDLARAVQSELASQGQQVSGADWSPRAPLVAFSARGDNAPDDLFRREVGPSTQTVNITSSNLVAERRPRFRWSGSVVAFERLDEHGQGTIWQIDNLGGQAQLTYGGLGNGALSATGEVVGTDTDPCYSPDDTQVAFRRLVDAGTGQRGEWSLIVMALPIGRPATETIIDDGPQFRGAPDWGSRGILFERTDEETGDTSLVLAAAEGAKVLVTLPAPTRVAYPRWLRAPQ